MIDIVKLYFVEYFRPHLRDVRIFLHGMWAMGFIVWALPGSHYSAEIRGWVFATLVTSLLLDAWDWVLRRHEAKARKEELYEYYRSEFETEKFRPVKSGAPVIDGVPHDGECLTAGNWGVTDLTVDKDPKDV